MGSKLCYETLISVSELNALMKESSGTQNSPVILDARFNLAAPDEGRAAHLAGHIPSAFYVHLDAQLSSPITPASGRHPLPDMQALASWFSAIGIQQSKQVIVYDDMAGAMAARCWWLLKLLNHQKVAVLDGGFPLWEKTGLAVETDLPEQPDNWLPPSITDHHNSPHAPVSSEDVMANLIDPRFLLIDARTAERYTGEQEPIDPVAGHVPRAINRPLQDNLINGRFKPADQLYAEWLNVLAGRPVSDVVHMCGSGVTACHNLLAMEHAGLSGSKVYAGSWSEWIRDPHRPVAIGPTVGE